MAYYDALDEWFQHISFIEYENFPGKVYGMEGKAKLPIGIENFMEMRTGGFYYVDKTGLIKTLLENPAYVNLFTRPGRFGKTLNMSMLKYFFEAGSDRTIFDGLEISGEKELCEEYMGKFPVISITLKGATGENFEEAKTMLRSTDTIEKEFASYLRKTISIRDTGVRKEMKENFYHGILLGLFGNLDGWKVKSNAESGDGYSDISVEIEDQEIGIVIELKYAENAAFDNACQEALKQINDRNYEEALIDDGMITIRKYGIACYKRRCKVISG